MLQNREGFFYAYLKLKDSEKTIKRLESDILSHVKIIHRVTDNDLTKIGDLKGQ